MTEDLADHPEWTDRDARLKVMDEQGVEGTWMFPSQGVVLEPTMHSDLEATVETTRAFNRWIEEAWGFAYRDRIFGVPFLTLCGSRRGSEGAGVVRRARGPHGLCPPRRGRHR